MDEIKQSDGYIAARKRDLAAILAGPELAPAGEVEALKEVLRLLDAVLSHEARTRLDDLKALYDPLDPDTPAARRAESPEAFDTFETGILAALARANFHEIDPSDVRTQEATRILTGLQIKTEMIGIRRIRYFARGEHAERIERPRFLGLGRRAIEANVYADVIVFVGFHGEDELKRAHRKSSALMRRGVRPGAALIKHFRNVARSELVTLHPGATPRMQHKDRLMLGVPAIAGGVPLLANLWPALTVLFAVVAAYFGAGFVIDNARLARAVGALGGLAALVAFLMRQRLKVEAQTLRYQKRLADTVYFRNISNNAGVLDLLIGAGEEQDVKEAFIAYWALRRAGRALQKPEIDAAAEQLLRERFQASIDFEITDALTKLERLGLVTKQGDAYAALAPMDALKALDTTWDSYFKYSVTA